MDSDAAKTEAAKALYGRFARISDPGVLDRRWNRLSEKQRENWISEASAAIDTYLNLMGF